MPTLPAFRTAYVANQLFPLDLAKLMTAIAGAESSWNPRAGGDTPAQLRGIGREDLAQLAQSYNCPDGSIFGPASIGLWQVFMPMWKDELARIGAPVQEPCALRTWLIDPFNNARAAQVLLSAQGLSAWRTYQRDLYRDYEPEVRASFELLLGCTGMYYLVRQGDTWASIANRFGVSAKALLSANPQIPDPNQLFSDHLICVVSPFPMCSSSQFVYVVGRNDTPSSLASRFEVTVRDLVEANPRLEQQQYLVVGQALCVPLVGSRGEA